MKNSSSYIETIFTVAIFVVLLLLSINYINDYYVAFYSDIKTNCLYFRKQYISNPIILSTRYQILTSHYPKISISNNYINISSLTSLSKELSYITTNGTVIRLFSNNNISIYTLENIYIIKLYTPSPLYLGNLTLYPGIYVESSIKIYQYNLLDRSSYLIIIPC